MSTYGYARVSTGGQELHIQMANLRAAGCERIYCEKESAMHDDRRALRRLLRVLKPSDVVITDALDRVTREGSFKMVSIVGAIVSRGAVCRSLTEPWADPASELYGILVALAGYVAHKTWDDLMRRTQAGRERARAKGVKFGRRPKLSPLQRRLALARRAAGESEVSIARSFHVSSSTIHRLEAAMRPPPLARG